MPVLHTHVGEWHYTALHSNTAHAHELGTIRDWVVIYYYTDQQAEGQCTVVTQRRGALAGRRVIRGREAECREHYAADASESREKPAPSGPGRSRSLPPNRPGDP